MNLNFLTGSLLEEEFRKLVLIGAMGLEIRLSHQNAMMQMVMRKQSILLPDED